MTFKNKIKDGFAKLKSNRKMQIYVGVAAVVVIIAIGGLIIYNNTSIVQLQLFRLKLYQKTKKYL